MTNQEQLAKSIDFMFTAIDTWCNDKESELDCKFCRFYDKEKDGCIFRADEYETKADKILKWLTSEEKRSD